MDEIVVDVDASLQRKRLVFTEHWLGDAFDSLLTVTFIVLFLFAGAAMLAPIISANSELVLWKTMIFMVASISFISLSILLSLSLVKKYKLEFVANSNIDLKELKSELVGLPFNLNVEKVDEKALFATVIPRSFFSWSVLVIVLSDRDKTYLRAYKENTRLGVSPFSYFAETRIERELKEKLKTFANTRS